MKINLKVAVDSRDLVAVRYFLDQNCHRYKVGKRGEGVVIINLVFDSVLGMAGRCYDIGRGIARVEEDRRTPPPKRIEGRYRRRRSLCQWKKLW
jgi:hypothetical protein